MPTTRLRYELSTICEQLSKAGVPHAMIGAMALAFYGIPRYTADIDLLSDDLQRDALLVAMTDLGYQCYHRTDLFMQFDRTDGAPGRVDFLCVSTDQGRAILHRSVTVNDELIGRVPVVQPTDYAVLKLMAIANNKERRAHDAADLTELIKADALGLINELFAPLDFMHIEKYAITFRVSDLLASLRKKRMGHSQNRKINTRQSNDRRIIFEMIEASIELALKKGVHPLTRGCNCITCVNQRKRILAGPPQPWRYHL